MLSLMLNLQFDYLSWQKAKDTKIRVLSIYKSGNCIGDDHKQPKSCWDFGAKNRKENAMLIFVLLHCDIQTICTSNVAIHYSLSVE